jgi:predicted nucleotidyltransferase
MVVLKGENQIERFSRVADRFVSEVSSYDGVSGIVLLGGLARGFVDEFSDVDVTVFLGKADKSLESRIRSVVEKEKHSGIDIDLDIYDVVSILRARWDDMLLWEYSKGKIVFDPKGECENAIKKKLGAPRDFWTKRISVLVEYLSWYCCPRGENVGTIAEAWVKRGDLTSAHYCLNYGVEVIVKLLYALNKEFAPAPKWLLFYSHNLAKLPEGFKKDVEEAMTARNLSLEELERRLMVLRRLWSKIEPMIQKETALTLSQLHDYYYRSILKR